MALELRVSRLQQISLQLRLVVLLKIEDKPLMFPSDLLLVLAVILMVLAGPLMELTSSLPFSSQLRQMFSSSPLTALCLTCTPTTQPLVGTPRQLLRSSRVAAIPSSPALC